MLRSLSEVNGGPWTSIAELNIIECLDEESEFCLGDFDANSHINIDDFVYILSDFGCLSECFADITGDSIVSIDDIILFLALFGADCN